AACRRAREPASRSRPASPSAAPRSRRSAPTRRTSSSSSAASSAALRPSFASARWAETRSSPRLDGRRLWRRLQHARVEPRLDGVRPYPPLVDFLGPVSRHLVTRADPPQLRHLVATARRLYVGTPRVEAAGGRRVRRARQVAREEDRHPLPLDDR